MEEEMDHRIVDLIATVVDARLLENRRLALRYDRVGLIVQSLLQAACLFPGCRASGPRIVTTAS
jgi:hypothetical protein